MNATDILASLGFTNATVVNELADKRLVLRIMTSKGWTYEKFRPDRLQEEIAAWANGREPGK